MCSKLSEACKIDLIKHCKNKYILIIYLELVQPMLKFKEIKNSIINNKSKSNLPKMQQSTTNYNCSPLTFKTIVRELSPIRKSIQPVHFAGKFQTDKKQSVAPFRQQNYKSDAKENSSRNLYYMQAPNFSDLSFKKIEFAAQTKRKCHPQQPSLYTDQQIKRKNSKGTLSFANLLQSKVPSSNSKGKCNIESERKDDRESSISKLKQKLFGMKRLICQKDGKAALEGPCIKKELTNRDIPCKLDAYDEDIVKVSIKEDSFPHQLDMAPFLR